MEDETIIQFIKEIKKTESKLQIKKEKEKEKEPFIKGN
jgi:hypothetical protein